MSIFLNIFKLQQSYQLKEKASTNYNKKAIYAFLHGVFKAINYIEMGRHNW